MSATEIIIILALVGYAIYQQTRQHQVVGPGQRFKLAIIYAIDRSGRRRPAHAAALSPPVAFLLISLALSIVRRAPARPPDHASGPPPTATSTARGPALTIGLFLGLVVAKFAIGAAAYILHISDDGGFGEILIMIAIMVAFRPQLSWRRARALRPSPGRFRRREQRRSLAATRMTAPGPDTRPVPRPLPRSRSERTRPGPRARQVTMALPGSSSSRLSQLSPSGK